MSGLTAAAVRELLLEATAELFGLEAAANMESDLARVQNQRFVAALERAAKQRPSLTSPPLIDMP